MTTATRVVVQALLGAVVGVSLVFIVSVVVGVVAVASAGAAHLPGLFGAQVGEENGTLAVSFVPNGTGMLVVVALSALIFAVQTARRSRLHQPA